MFTTMELGDGSAAAVAANKVGLLRSISALELGSSVLGQFEGYLDDETVPKGSCAPPRPPPCPALRAARPALPAACPP
eukprot:SAG11_NODE_3116_length_2674_cov_4.690097_1_plen_77_part_10